VSWIELSKPFVLRIFFLICSLFLVSKASFCQYYLRGELKDEQGNGVHGARIALSSKGSYPFFTGSSGAFGIPTSLKIDTITFTLSGYDTLRAAVITSQYAVFTLKALKRNAATTIHLSSYTKDLSIGSNLLTTSDGESYSSTIENPIINTATNPKTGFALHIDRASYSNVRRFLNTKEQLPADAVRIEEMLNYFNLKTTKNIDQQKVFNFSSRLTSCPWNSENQLLFINLNAKKINLDHTPVANFVFLIDVSGSMDVQNKLPLLKSAFKLLVENLRSTDIVSIVTYGDVVTELLLNTPGDQKQVLIEAIEGLRPMGATPGASAIKTAYKIAKSNYIASGNNRVILASDGDFNVGQNSEKDLEELVTQETKAGIYLTCLGVGMDNYKDSKLEALAKKGNGNFAYLDNETEAEKVLIEEFSQTLYAVANNVFVDVEFDPRFVKEYRLIGYDNKKNAIANKTVELDGGDIGSGHSILAAFEITPATATAAIQYAEDKILANLQLSYKIPGSNETIQERYEIPQNYIALHKADSCLRFASSIIMFGTLLKQSQFVKNYSWDNVTTLANSATNPKNLLEKEFIDLIAKAKKIYSNKKKK
jgi:Ca-activated chloride channel family protein